MVDLLTEFLSETRDNLAQLDDDMLALERNPQNAALIARPFRALHTIKGSCGFLKLPRLENVARLGENLLAAFRDQTHPITPQAVALVLSIVSVIRTITASLEEYRKEPSGDDTALEKDVLSFFENPTQEAQSTLPTQSVKLDQRPVSDLRISIRLLDELMDLMSELVLARNELLQIEIENKNAVISQKIHHLDTRVSALQDCILKTRMHPIRRMWQSLPRVVHDLALAQNKKIDLVMTGDETELDRQIIDQLKEPFIHLIRNAVDHGLETPQERRAMGKPEAGTIRLHATQEESRIIITIEDDGRGLNLSAIARKAMEKNFSVPDDASDHLLHRLVFSPGFSTTDYITDISGRGVGLDVVKTQVEKIGGSIDISSAENTFCRFTLIVPLTVAIIPALMIKAGIHSFALPQSCIAELIRIDPASPAFKKLGQETVFEWRDHLVPLLSLRTMLDINQSKQSSSLLTVIVLTVATHSFAALIDGVSSMEEIIVKPLPQVLSAATAFTGTTILGDGKVSLILNPTFLAQNAHISDTQTKFLQPEEKKQIPHFPPHLLFETAAHGTQAISLHAIDHLITIDAQEIVYQGNLAFLHYRDNLLPLLAYDPQQTIKHSGAQSVLVVPYETGQIGLCVDAIDDIIEDIDFSNPHVIRQKIVSAVAINPHIKMLMNARGTA